MALKEVHTILVSEGNIHNMKVPDPFKFEEQRDLAAKRHHYKKLRSLYESKIPAIKDRNTPRLWDTLNTDKNAVHAKNPMEADRLRIVTRLLRHGSILNVGCGSGKLEEMNRMKMPRWYGIDISSKSIKKAQERFPGGKFSMGNILAIHYPECHFDYVVALEVLEHIPPKDTFTALEQLYRVLKPQGCLIISVPMNEGLEKMITQGHNPNAHVRMYTPELINAELKIAGFAIIWERQLFAFHHFYRLKTLLARIVFKKKWQPNNVIIKAKKLS